MDELDKEPGRVDDWAPIKIDVKELLIQVGYGAFLYIFIALYILFIPIDIRTIWVLVNIIIGYAILSSKKARNYYWEMFKGFGDRKAWLYAILNLILIFSTIMIPFIVSLMANGGGDANGTGDGSNANPFVSNYIFLLFVIPIIPLFADAETKIFQGWIIKGLNSKRLIDCPECGRKTLPLKTCDLCGKKLTENKVVDFSNYYPAIIVSGVIFGIAHVILVGSITPIVLTIGGILLGYLYVKEGAWLVARVHMIYDYLIIGLIIFGGLF